MASRNDTLVEALTLMDQALTLLDAADECLAAVHLQHAMESVRKSPINPGERHIGD